MTQISTSDKREVPAAFDRVARSYDLLTTLNPDTANT